MRLTAIILLLAAGILAGAQLGKVAPLVAWYQADEGFSLVLIGWLAALIGLFVALAALPAGVAIQRFGTRRASTLSFIVLAAGTFWLAAAHGAGPVLAARLLEGVGYLVLVIAVPALLSDLSPANWRGPVMAVWGGFVPIGFAMANFLADAVIPVWGERGFLFLLATAFSIAALCATPLIWRVADADPQRFADAEDEATGRGLLARTLTRDIQLLAIAFGAYVIGSLGFFTFLPTFIAQSGSHILISAALIALLVPAGNLLAGLLMTGRDGRFAVLLSAAGFAATILAAVPAFTLATPLAATLAASIVAIGGGVIASALFAAVPSHVPPASSVSIAIGLVAQAGGIGTVIGPPLTAAIIENWSWGTLGLYLAAAAALGLAALLPLMRAR